MATAQLLPASRSCAASRRQAQQHGVFAGQVPAIGLATRQPAARRAAWAAPEGRRCRQRRCTLRRLPALPQQQQQQQEAEERRQDAAEADESALQDLKLPKFRPFTPMNAVQRAMTSFRFEHPLPDGCTLVVVPLAADWLGATADLLTDSFAEAMAAAGYTNYLRRQVKAYLEAHMAMPPKAVVLVALLLPPAVSVAPAPAVPPGQELGSEEQQQVVQEEEQVAGWGEAAASSSSSGSDVGGDGTPGMGSNGRSISSNSSSGLQVESVEDSLGCSTSGEGTGLPADELEQHAAAWQQEQQQQEQRQQEQRQMDSMDMGDGMAMHPLLSTSGGSSSSSGSGDEAAAAAAGSSTADQVDPTSPAGGAVLAGVVELSFSASTRSAYLTLKPPEDRCYLCNMATHVDHRGRGYGFLVMQAAEQLVASLGENEIYLHLRVQDAPAARLYNKAGFQEVKADLFLVRLLGMDQRRLMRKVLPTR